jgi:inhibitor of KinA sporulation pathway (predicted exonuclease)
LVFGWHLGKKSNNKGSQSRELLIVDGQKGVDDEMRKRQKEVGRNFSKNCLENVITGGADKNAVKHMKKCVRPSRKPILQSIMDGS